jgi:predicted RNase H-like nuclease (RuvC/YqgF family)
MHGTMKKPRHKHPSAAQRARSASGAAESDRQDKGRWSSRRKTEVVLRLLRGETIDALSRELGVTTGRLAEWRDEALAAMQAGLQSREPDHRDGFIHDLKAKVGDQAMQIELLQRKIDMLEDGLRPPPRRPSL